MWYILLVIKKFLRNFFFLYFILLLHYISQPYKIPVLQKKGVDNESSIPLVLLSKNSNMGDFEYIGGGLQD